MARELWKPSVEQVEGAAMTAFARQAGRRHGLDLGRYADLHAWSVERPEQFWEEVAEFCGMRFSRRWDAVLERGEEFKDARWFTGSRLNFAENLLRHSEGERADMPAVIFHAESGERREVTFRQLRREAAGAAGALRRWGVRSGDRVAGYLPNQPETVSAMLAATSMGAIWTACSPDFGVEAACDRMVQAEPKVLFATPGYRYNGKVIDVRAKAQAVAERAGVERLVWVPYPGLELEAAGGERWEDLAGEGGEGDLQFEQTEFGHPVYMMYSSGTTGKPKCIVHGAGGTLIQHYKEHVLHVGLTAEDRMFYFTTCGWMMWQWLVGALAVGAAIVLYDGSPFHPGPERLWDMAERERLTVFGTSARYLAELQRAGCRPMETHDLGSVRALLSTGSPLLEDQFEYVYRHVKRDLCLSSISGGTDIVSCFVLGNPALPVHAGQIQCKGLGMDVAFLDDDGRRLVGSKGELACRQPFPSMPVKFWNDPGGERYHGSYFGRREGVWMHGDYGTELLNGGVVIHGRSDAVLNPGGVRIGTAEIYGQLEQVEDVADAIVVEQEVEGDSRIVLFVVMRGGAALTEEARGVIRRRLREGASPRHVPACIEQVEAVPRTLNGKLAELAVRDVVHGRQPGGLEALANPECLEQFRDRV